MVKSFVQTIHAPKSYDVHVLAFGILPEGKIHFDRMKYLNKLDITRQRIFTLGHRRMVLKILNLLWK